MNIPVITVTELNRYVKTMFDTELMMQSILVSGEISNLSVHAKTGHMYFSLKDENAALKAVMFSSAASYLNFRPENGMKVLALGRVGVFERDGVYQLYVNKMQPDGAGALAVAFEQLKKKLASEGLFDASRKKQIPRFPKTIGVITSPTGAAVRDIFSVINRRFPVCTVVFKGVSVQGAKAPEEIINAIEEFDRKKCADVLIVARGGGSAEDLWCFNDERLARAIAGCSIPVVSGVGHETDFTICDFVSDLRAPTPSAAAEIVTPDIDAMRMDVATLTESLFDTIKNKTEFERHRLELLLSHRSFASAESFFEGEKNSHEKLRTSLFSLTEKNFSSRRLLLDTNISKLDGLNPLSVLTRGFAAVSVNGKIADSVHSLSVGQNISIRFSDGTAEASIIKCD